MVGAVRLPFEQTNKAALNRIQTMNTLRNKLLVGLFVPALAFAAGAASATDGTSKITGQAETNGSTNRNDKSPATTGATSATGDTGKITGQAETNGSTNTNDKSTTTSNSTDKQTNASRTRVKEHPPTAGMDKATPPDKSPADTPDSAKHPPTRAMDRAAPGEKPAD